MVLPPSHPLPLLTDLHLSISSFDDEALLELATFSFPSLKHLHLLIEESSSPTEAGLIRALGYLPSTLSTFHLFVSSHLRNEPIRYEMLPSFPLLTTFLSVAYADRPNILARLPSSLRTLQLVFPASEEEDGVAWQKQEEFLGELVQWVEQGRLEFLEVIEIIMGWENLSSLREELGIATTRHGIHLVKEE